MINATHTIWNRDLSGMSQGNVGKFYFGGLVRTLSMISECKMVSGLGLRKREISATVSWGGAAFLAQDDLKHIFSFS